MKIPEGMMPKFFFNIRRGGFLEVDDDGLELPSIDEAVQEATLAARDILTDKLVRGYFEDEECIEVTAQDGVVLGRVPFKFDIAQE